MTDVSDLAAAAAAIKDLRLALAAHGARLEVEAGDRLAIRVGRLRVGGLQRDPDICLRAASALGAMPIEVVPR